MTYTLRSRDGGTRTYWVSDTGGYVYQTYPGRPAQSGRQVCTALDHVGDTLYIAHAKYLPAVIRRERRRERRRESTL